MVHDSRTMSTIDGDHVRVVIAPIDETRFTGSGSDQHLHHNLLSRLRAVFEAVLLFDDGNATGVEIVPDAPGGKMSAKQGMSQYRLSTA